jgi:hypothetical protein
MIKPQIINKDGKPAFVVLPIDDWEHIKARLEDKEDAALARERLANPGEAIPHSVMKAIIAGAQPVKTIREWRGMSQAELARAADSGTVYISQIERRIRHASGKLRARMAAALRVDEDLLRDDQPA